MGYTDLAAFETAFSVEDRCPVLKVTVTNSNPGGFQSQWKSASVPAAGATPGAAATCDNTTLGGIAFRNITTGKRGYLSTMQFSRQGTANDASENGTIILYDRLIQNGGLAANTTLAQTVNTPALPARLNSSTGVDVEAFIEYYTGPTGTGVTATIAYTDSTNAAQTTTVGIGQGSTGVLVVIPAAAGAVGWKSVQTVTLSGTMTTGGNFGITLAWRIAQCPETGARFPNVRWSAQDLCFAPIHPSSCLWITILNGCSLTNPLGGILGIVEEP